MEHTKGTVEAIDVAGETVIWSSRTRDIICNLSVNTFGGNKERHEANAHRLTACWNACEGIEDPEKYIKSVTDIAASLVKSVDEADELRKQRDALLDAAIGVMPVIDPRYDRALKKAIALCDKE